MSGGGRLHARLRGRLGAQAALSGLLMLGACTEEAASNNPGPPAQLALSCPPQSARACPCPGVVTTGSQFCFATGDGYGPCEGCPPPPLPMDPLGPAGAGAPTAMLDAGAPVAATDASVGVDAAMQATPDAGSVGEGTDAAIERLGLAPAGPAPGVSCGVGLPVLCALDGEKCCARSLSTDTCIEASASCDCEFGDCMVMEAFCDGPEDCPMGQVCCGTLAGGSGYERFECAATCDYAGTQRIACHQEAPECPDGNECANSQLLTNVQVCIDPATIRQ